MLGKIYRDFANRSENSLTAKHFLIEIAPIHHWLEISSFFPEMVKKKVKPFLTPLTASRSTFDGRNVNSEPDGLAGDGPEGGAGDSTEGGRG